MKFELVNEKQLNRARINKLLISLGITADIKGFHYLSYAINHVREVFKSGRVNIYMMHLYEDIANIYGNTPKTVEQIMRFAVRKAAKHPTATFINVFSYDETAPKITIAAFICTAAQYLLDEE
jgi:hypothetical protein